MKRFIAVIRVDDDEVSADRLRRHINVVLGLNHQGPDIHVIEMRDAAPDDDEDALRRPASRGRAAGER